MTARIPAARRCRTLWGPRLLPVLALAVLPAWAQVPPLSLDDALALAVQDAPTLSASQARIEAADQARRTAGAWPDPRLALGVENLPVSGPERYRLTADGMTMQRIAVMQDWPNTGKREARVAAAERRVAAEQAREADERRRLRAEVAQAWIRRHTLERQLDALQALEAENQALAAWVQAQLAGGRGSALEAVMPRQEAAQLEQRRDVLRAQQAQAVAALRRWIGVAAERPLAAGGNEARIDARALTAAVEHHPRLQAAQAEVRLLEAERHEALAGKRPDWGLELAYQRRGRAFGDMVSVQVTIDLPVFPGARQDPQIAARAAAQRAAQAELEVARRELAQALEADLAEGQRLDRTLVRYETQWLPLADDKVALALAAYRAGTGSLAELLAARRERIETRLEHLAVQGERQALAARLHFTYLAEGDQP